MDHSRKQPRHLPVIAQIALVAGGLLTVAFYPPADGRMLVVPVSVAARAAIVPAALAGGARIVGLGPLPGSLVIVGNRGALRRAIAARPIVIIAAPSAGCGPVQESRV